MFQVGAAGIMIDRSKGLMKYAVEMALCSMINAPRVMKIFKHY
jgi:hypothetical protein